MWNWPYHPKFVTHILTVALDGQFVAVVPAPAVHFLPVGRHVLRVCSFIWTSYPTGIHTRRRPNHPSLPLGGRHDVIQIVTSAALSIYIPSGARVGCLFVSSFSAGLPHRVSQSQFGAFCNHVKGG